MNMHSTQSKTDVRSNEIARVRRFQQDGLFDAVGRAGVTGLRASQIGERFGWPIDSTLYWIDCALQRCEITVAARDEHSDDPHYVTLANRGGAR
jgi:hypothetical protein